MRFSGQNSDDSGWGENHSLGSLPNVPRKEFWDTSKYARAIRAYKAHDRTVSSIGHRLSHAVPTCHLLIQVSIFSQMYATDEETEAYLNNSMPIVQDSTAGTPMAS